MTIHPTDPTDPTEPTRQLGEPGTEPTTAFARPADETEPPLLPTDRPVEDPPARQLSVSYLVTGLVFLGIAGLWLAQETGAVQAGDLEVLAPLLLVVVGAAGLVASLAKAVRRDR